MSETLPCVVGKAHILMFMNEQRLADIGLIAPKIGDEPLAKKWGPLSFLFRPKPIDWACRASIHGQQRKLFSHINYAPPKPPHRLIDTIHNRGKSSFRVKTLLIHRRSALISNSKWLPHLPKGRGYDKRPHIWGTWLDVSIIRMDGL